MQLNTPNGWLQVTTRIGIALAVVFALVLAVLVVGSTSPVDMPGGGDPVASQIDMTCGSTQEFLQTMTDTGETVSAVAQPHDQDSIATLWTNTGTGTFTLAITSKQDPTVTCMLLYGNQFVPIVLKKYM